MAKLLKISPKYRVTMSYMIGYYFLMFVCIILILGYLFPFLRIGFVLQLYTEFYYHVSNLCISIIFYLGIGFMWMIQGVKFRYVVLLGGVTAVANVVCETMMGFMNTTDFVDAIYGLIGTAIGFAYLAIIYRNGLIPLEEKSVMI